MVALDIVTIVAACLLAAGVVGSALPSVPGPLLSLAGIVVFWLGGGTGVSETILIVLGVVAVLVVVFDWLAGALAAKYGGASWTSSIVGGIVGILLLFVFGPIGVILGVAITIFVMEALRKNPRHATRAATYSTVGALGSAVVQVVMTLGILVTFTLSVL